MAGAVGSRAGALRRRATAIVGGHAAEGALVDLAIFGTAERHAVVFEFVDGIGRIAAQVFDRVLVAEPVGALHGVVHVPLPAVGTHVADRSGDAALRRHGVRACGEHLRHAGGLEARFRAAECRAEAGATGADDDHVVHVIGDGIGLAVHGWICHAVAGAICLSLRHVVKPRGSVSGSRRRTSARRRCRRMCLPSAPALCGPRCAHSPR